MHGIMVANRWARIPETLDVYFEENLGDFLVGKLRHIDVERITHRAKYTAGYGMKGLKRPTFSEDDVLVLPRALSQLPGRHTGCTAETDWPSFEPRFMSMVRAAWRAHLEDSRACTGAHDAA